MSLTIASLLVPDSIRPFVAAVGGLFIIVVSGLLAWLLLSVVIRRAVLFLERPVSVVVDKIVLLFEPVFTWSTLWSRIRSAIPTLFGLGEIVELFDHEKEIIDKSVTQKARLRHSLSFHIRAPYKIEPQQRRQFLPAIQAELDRQALSLTLSKPTAQFDLGFGASSQEQVFRMRRRVGLGLKVRVLFTDRQRGTIVLIRISRISIGFSALRGLMLALIALVPVAHFMVTVNDSQDSLLGFDVLVFVLASLVGLLALFVGWLASRKITDGQLSLLRTGLLSLVRDQIERTDRLPHPTAVDAPR